MIRQTFMPAVLVECAYLMCPPEEELLLNPDFETQIARSIVAGIETFLRNRQN